MSEVVDYQIMYEEEISSLELVVRDQVVMEGWVPIGGIAYGMDSDGKPQWAHKKKPRGWQARLSRAERISSTYRQKKFAAVADL